MSKLLKFAPPPFTTPLFVLQLLVIVTTANARSQLNVIRLSGMPALRKLHNGKL